MSDPVTLKSLIEKLASVYGQITYGLIALLILWVFIVKPELHQNRISFDQQRTIVESQRATADSMAATARIIERAAEKLESAAERWDKR